MIDTYPNKFTVKELIDLLEKFSSDMRVVTQGAIDALKANGNKVTIIADRESDIYEEWVRITSDEVHMLTRSRCDRVLFGCKDSLYNYSDNLEVAGQYDLFLRGIPGKRQKRNTVVNVRYSEVRLKKPNNCSDKSAPEFVDVWLVGASEDISNFPNNEKPIHWRILTTHKVNDVDSAMQIVKWYCQRWHIEQLFRTPKSQGIDAESSQVEDGNALIKLILIALHVATKAMQLVNSREGENERKADNVFDEEEIKFLTILVQKLEGKTEKQKNKFTLGSLAWAAWIIARLGGWKGYASESPPGPITMSYGLKVFEMRYWGWALAKEVMCID